MAKIWGWGLTGAVLLGLMEAAIALPTAAANDPDDLHQALELAVCRGDWTQAMAVVDPLIATATVTAAERQDLVQLRYQLQSWQQLQAGPDLSAWEGCDRSLSRLASQPLPQVQRRLDWRASLDAELGVPVRPRPDIITRTQGQPVTAAQLLSEVPDALQPVRLLNTQDGFSVVSGAVDTDYQVFAFIAALGDPVTLRVNVTDFRPGQLFNNDDSHLFLFDRQGRLIAENDDAIGLQSEIDQFVIPETNLYYAVVTTYNNRPLMDSEGRVFGWTNEGGSDIDYTLTITGLTPIPAVQELSPQEGSPTIDPED
jgi:hypothetical protein